MAAQLQTFLLVVVRVGSFIAVCPGFSMKGTPNLMKVGLAIGISIPLFSLVPVFETELATFAFITLIAKETLIGLAIGYISQLFFTAVEMAGAFADVQVGFSMAQLFDPSIGINASYLGRVYYWIALAIFFFADLHHLLIQSLAYSFQELPLAQMGLYNPADGVLQLFSVVFETAFQLAAPLIIIALLTEMTLGVLSRTVPQINVLILSMPLKVMVVLIFLLAFLPTLIQNIGDVLPLMLKYTNDFIYSFKPL